jgi:hypothetical protein
LFALSKDYATRGVDSDFIDVFFAENVDRNFGVDNDDDDDGDIDGGDIMTMMMLIWIMMIDMMMRVTSMMIYI